MLNTHFANIVKSYASTIEHLTHCYVFIAPIEENGEFSIDIELSNGSDIQETFCLTPEDGHISMTTNGDLYSYRAKIMNDIAESISEKMAPKTFNREDFFERNGLDIKDEMQWDEVTGLAFTNENQTEPRVYLDMDGTLAVFNKNATMEEVFSPGYFRGLQPIQEMVEFAKQLIKEGYDVHILSGACYSAVQEKIEWLREHMPFVSPDNYSFVPVGADKSKFIPDPKHSILIDDYNKNLTEWKGLAVKCVTDINNPNPAFVNLDIKKEQENNLEMFENAINEWLPKDSLTFNDYAILTYSENESIDRPKIICRDGFEFWVETGENSHTEPNVQPFKTASFRSVEIVKPSAEDERLKVFANEYLYLSEPITESNIPYVPVELIEEMIKDHGGIDTEKTFSKEYIEQMGIDTDLYKGALDNLITESGINTLTDAITVIRNMEEIER